MQHELQDMQPPTCKQGFKQTSDNICSCFKRGDSPASVHTAPPSYCAPFLPEQPRQCRLRTSAGVHGNPQYVCARIPCCRGPGKPHTQISPVEYPRAKQMPWPPIQHAHVALAPAKPATSSAVSFLASTTGHPYLQRVAHCTSTSLLPLDGNCAPLWYIVCMQLWHIEAWCKCRCIILAW